ncbi:MAG: DUF2079 domain-containing protein [Fimbriimonadaceae bacterium]|nr:DUF2079 domain-containing protein [Fimbriimonadaceae bacterium]
MTDPLPPPRPWAVALLTLAMLLFAGVYGQLATAAYRWYVASWDLAMNHQAVWLLAHGEPTFLTTRNLPAFGHHLSLVLYPLSWLYRLWPDAAALLWAQTVVAAAGAVPVFALARRLTRADGPAVAWAVLYLSQPALQHLVLHDLHFQPFALPCFLAALACVASQRWRAMGCWLALALLSREDAALPIALLGLALWRTAPRRVALTTLAGGLLATVLAYQVVLPWINRGQQIFYADLFYGHLGGSPVEVLLSPLLRPRVVLESLWQEANLRLLVGLLGPLAGLALLRPAWLLPAAATLFLNMVSSFWPSHVIDYHYQGFVIPFGVAAAVAGGTRLEQAASRGGARPAVARWLAPTVALLATFLLPVLQPPGSTWLPRQVSSPSQWPTQVAAWRAQRQWAPQLDTVLAAIPTTASVSASMSLLPQVAARREAWLFPCPFFMLIEGFEPLSAFSPAKLLAGLQARPVEWILLQTQTRNRSPLDEASYREALRTVEASGLYDLAHDLGGVRVYRRRGVGR